MSACASNRSTNPAGGCFLPLIPSDSEVFKLTPSGGQWKCTSLHNFGGLDALNLSIDAHGNLYGTESLAGYGYYGNIWEITQ